MFQVSSGQTSQFPRCVFTNLTLTTDNPPSWNIGSLVLMLLRHPCPGSKSSPGTKRNVVQTEGAQNHFLSVCIYNSNRFVDRLTAATSNRRETWVKNMALMESCADKCPCPGTVPEGYLRSARPLKCYVHIGARAQAPNPSTKSGRSLRNR